MEKIELTSQSPCYHTRVDLLCVSLLHGTKSPARLTEASPVTRLSLGKAAPEQNHLPWEPQTSERRGPCNFSIRTGVGSPWALKSPAGWLCSCFARISKKAVICSCLNSTDKLEWISQNSLHWMETRVTQIILVLPTGALKLREVKWLT